MQMMQMMIKFPVGNFTKIVWLKQQWYPWNSHRDSTFCREFGVLHLFTRSPLTFPICLDDFFCESSCWGNDKNPQDTPMQVPLNFYKTWAPEMRNHAKSLGKDRFGIWGEFYVTPARYATMTGRGRDSTMLLGLQKKTYNHIDPRNIF